MDTAFMVIFLFVIVVASVLAYYTYDKISDELSGKINGEAAEAVEEVKNSFNILDYFFLAIFVGMLIVMIILAFYIRTHPAMTFVYILILIINVVLATAISNAYYALSLDESLVSTISQRFEITDYLMRNLPLEIAIVGIILLIVMYAKSSDGAPI